MSRELARRVMGYLCSRLLSLRDGFRTRAGKGTKVAYAADGILQDFHISSFLEKSVGKS